MSSVTLNTQGLQSLKRKLKTAEKARAEVGIFSSHDARSDGKSNIEIGWKHELGVIGEKIPKRSFIKMPCDEELPKIIEGELGELSDAFIKDGAKAMLERVGFMGEAAIQSAFDTGGFGQWPSNSEYTIAMKGRNEPLIDTSQLRGAISSRVK